MIDIAKSQYAHEKQVSIKEIEKEVEKKFADEAANFANNGQEESIEAYDPFDLDEPENVSESENALEEPEEDDLEICSLTFGRTF